MLILQHLQHLCIMLHKVLISPCGDVLSRFCFAKTTWTCRNQLPGADKNDLNANKEQKFCGCCYRTLFEIVQKIRGLMHEQQVGLDRCRLLSLHQLRFCLTGRRAELTGAYSSQRLLDFLCLCLLASQAGELVDVFRFHKDTTTAFMVWCMLCVSS